MAFRERTLAWLDIQGYYDLPIDERRRLSVPLRFAPALCTALSALALVTQPAPGLALMAVVATAGTLLPRHPFDYLYGWVVNPVLKTGQAPKTPPRRKIQCGVAAVIMAASAALFAAGYTAAGWVLGGSFIVVGVTLTVTNWCAVLYVMDRLREFTPWKKTTSEA